MTPEPAETLAPEPAEPAAPAAPADVLAAQVESLLRRVESLEVRLEALGRAYRRLPYEVVYGYGTAGYAETHKMDAEIEARRARRP